MRRRFTSEMQHYLLYYIPGLFLMIFIVSLDRMHSIATTTAFDQQRCVELTKEHSKSIHAPGNDFNFSLTDLFEKETEDETEAEFHAALPILSLTQNLTDLILPDKIHTGRFFNEYVQAGQDPLFLIVRSIRM